MVVAISGGPDSVALLRGLLAQPSATKVAKLVVAHLNHQLRGEESVADEEFVRGLYEALRADSSGTLQLRCERLDVVAAARAEGGNVESVARRLRYAWLAEVARQEQMAIVATGHTTDDQAETVLHRLLRGTGIRGLRGIAAEREFVAGIMLVRPLLNATREEILAFLQELNQPFRQDSSNLVLSFTRNRIRHELLPHLAKNYNSAIRGILSRLAEGAEEVYRWYESEALRLLAESELPKAGALLVLDKNKLAKAPRHLVREVFCLVWSREGWPTNAMNFDAWDRLAELVFDEASDIDLPGGIRGQRRNQVVQLGPY
jgi:tRNA(Ile)-lysidine synthase